MTITDKIKDFVVSLGYVLTMLLGEYWFVFAGYLLLQTIDTISGFAYVRINHCWDGAKAKTGITVKVLNWLLISVSFLIPQLLTMSAALANINLSFMAGIGYLTIAVLIINETKSIFDNLTKCGVKIPKVLQEEVEKNDIDN